MKEGKVTLAGRLVKFVLADLPPAAVAKNGISIPMERSPPFCGNQSPPRFAAKMLEKPTARMRPQTPASGQAPLPITPEFHNDGRAVDFVVKLLLNLVVGWITAHPDSSFSRFMLWRHGPVRMSPR